MTTALHIYLDPCATPQQVRLNIKELAPLVSWIGVLGSAPWMSDLSKISPKVELIKGNFASADDRNRLTSLTPAKCNSVLWIYGSDLLRYPGLMTVRGSNQVDVVSIRCAVIADSFGRTDSYRYAPRLLARRLFNWAGQIIPAIKLPAGISIANNNKASIETNIFSLSGGISASSELSVACFEEALELLSLEILTEENSLGCLLQFAGDPDILISRKSFLLAKIAESLLKANELTKAKSAIGLAVETKSVNILHISILAQLALIEADYEVAKNLALQGLALNWPQSEFPLKVVLIHRRLFEALAMASIKLASREGAEAAMRGIENDPELQKTLGSENMLALSAIAGRSPNIRTGISWPDKSIAYFCGQGAETWDDTSLENGVGGSESAVIYLSREWAKSGYAVTIFGSPYSEHTDPYGVEWKNHSRGHAKDLYDIFIGWRATSIFDQTVKSRLSLLDCHDILADSEIDARKLSRIHFLMVKSNYHRNNLTGIPDERFRIISNGVDLDLLVPAEDQHRDLYRLIYASSYDRGLDRMLEIGWPRIKKACPQAELHIFYGWNTYDRMEDPKGIRAKWKQKMLELFKQDGIFEHGRIGQKALLAEKMKASLHYYGTIFEEIDCITVRESAAVGCLPVTSKYAALAEKNYLSCVEGYPDRKQTQLDIADKVLEMLGKPLQQERRVAMEMARKESWQEIAAKWVNIFEGEGR